MKADPFVQLRLLDLQAVDTAVTQRMHRRRTLPELAVIADAGARISAGADDVVRGETEIGDLDREQRRLELDVEQVRARSARDEQRLSSGDVSSPKELERLQHEVQSLARRQGDLEERVLEVMERREDADSRLAALRRTADQAAAEQADAEGRRDAAFVQIDTELAEHETERTDLLSRLPEDLVTLYERIRSQSGTGAAALQQRRCQGCRMEMANTSLSRARTAASDEVLRCEECGRILVRTAESGL